MEFNLIFKHLVFLYKWSNCVSILFDHDNDGKFDQEWYYDANDTQSLTVPAATTSEGTCGGEALLVIKLSDYITDPNQFKRYCSVELTISQTN